MKKWTEIHSPKDLILYQDDTYVVANKPAGVPSQPDKTGDLSMSEWLEQQIGVSLHLISRLDRPVSGAMVCSKNGEISDARSIQKHYLAITNAPEEEKATLEHFIFRDGRRHKAYITDQERGKQATLHYRTIQTLDKYVVLEVLLDTGRFHQIRAQLAHIGSPIKGDVKYGARRGNPDRSIDLHAYKIQFPQSSTSIIAPVIAEQGIWKHVDFSEISS